MALIGYATTEEFEAAAASRGVTLLRPSSQTLTQALDYIELQTYKGEKTDPDQFLEWPRNGDTEIPLKIKLAQMEAAGIYDKGGDPLGDVGQRVTQETVFGAVSVSYSDKGNQSTVYRKLNATLAPFLASGGYGSSNFAVSHG
jgi:hypothetical protein